MPKVKTDTCICSMTETKRGSILLINIKCGRLKELNFLELHNEICRICHAYLLQKPVL